MLDAEACFPVVSPDGAQPPATICHPAGMKKFHVGVISAKRCEVDPQPVCHLIPEWMKGGSLVVENIRAFDTAGLRYPQKSIRTVRVIWNYQIRWER